MSKLDLMIDCESIEGVEVISTNEIRISAKNVDIAELLEDEKLTTKIIELADSEFDSEFVDSLGLKGALSHFSTDDVLDALDLDYIVSFVESKGYEVSDA